jgi:hypothetical protein
MNADQLQEFKDKFDHMLAETTDEELFEFFEKSRLERLSRIRVPQGYRLLKDGEITQVGDLYNSGDGYWILYDDGPYEWTDTEDYLMIRLL